MEGAFCDGRTYAVCDPAQGRRDDGFAVTERTRPSTMSNSYPSKQSRPWHLAGQFMDYDLG